MALEPLAHLYDLALRALAEQERQVTDLRGRMAPLLAAGGLGATLLTPAAFRGEHPSGPAQTICVAVAVIGMFVVVFAATYVLIPSRLAFGIDASSASAFLRRHAVVNLHGFYASMTMGLDERRLGNTASIRRLRVAFTFMLFGMLVGLCGLAAAAAVA